MGLGMQGHTIDNADPPPVPPVDNTPLSFVIPTEFVDLPSKGKYYPAGHPLKDQETIEIRHMTAKDEDILTSRTLLKKGIAVDRMIQNIIVDKAIKIQDLLIGDKNAVIVAARINGYGPEYEVKTACPTCGYKNNTVFNLSELNTQAEQEEVFEEHSIEKTDNNTFLLTVPRSKVVVELKLMTSHDETAMAARAQKRKKHNLPDTLFTDQLRTIIASVQGDPSTVGQYINSLPALDSRYIRKIYNLIMPSIDLTQDFVCTECDQEDRLEVPFTTEFFWPKR